jgi:hypothetical protein
MPSKKAIAAPGISPDFPNPNSLVTIDCILFAD